MKNRFFTFGLMISFFVLSQGLRAQTTQASFAGVWRMKPFNVSHNLSKLNIIDNGTSITIGIKKLNLKNIPAKYDPQERKLHFTVSGTDYFLVYVPANGSLMGYNSGTGAKYGDYVK